MRSDLWLQLRLEKIWNVLMPEVKRLNSVNIKFKGNWKTKFGHIKKQKDGSTEIVINNLFRNEQVPEFIIDTTIAHELIHYMHGFHSPLPKQFIHPHQGGIVDRELKNRGFGFLLKLEKDWIKNKWWTTFPSLKEEIS
ncbi:hypothetical protein HOG16_01375 [Candidatus Woesearchaeota archaeon]|jgi:hypothetical protein|nr:hypothetical protein [Candidatus Woesearchaeota archaeon]MBT4321797.1 hypothetical protein [Candidatus Woesearchaeota archaeon]MBT4630805.1 hypothetical protein [Candidatus Woesearchaeota archaeon]